MKRFLFGFILISVFLGIIYGSYRILNVKTYKVRFDSVGGSKIAPIEVKSNDSIKKLPQATKENYQFLGWYDNDELFDVNMPITKNYTLEAKWALKDKEVYTISFDTLGGSKIEDLKFYENEELSMFPAPEKAGYTFKNWLYQNKAVESITVTKNMTLVALYQKNS